MAVSEQLAGAAEEIAAAWGAAMLTAAPLQEAARLQPARLAQDGPMVVEVLARALAAREEISDLAGRAAPAAAEIAGAGEPARASAAVEVLRAVVWERLAQAAADPPWAAGSARALYEAADRLSEVCSLLLSAMLRSGAGAAGLAGGGRTIRPPARSAPGAAAIVDEWEEPREERGRPAGPPREGSAGPGREGPAGEGRGVPAASAAEPGAGRSQAPPPEVEYARAPIEIRDQRAGEGPAAWIGSIGRELERFRSDGRPFAVLLVELSGVAAGESARLEQALEDALVADAAESSRSRPRVRVTAERPGRCWLIAPDTGPGEADALAERVRRMVAAGRRAGSAPAVLVGRASCPRDGRRAAELAAHADVDLYAARAAARTAEGSAR